MKLELTHDLLAREIFDSITRSAPELVQLKQKEQYVQAQYAYFREESRSFLTREELAELLPFIEFMNIEAEERKFVTDSHDLVQRKRRIRIGSIALVSLLLLAISAAVLYYAYQAKLSDVRADEAAVYSETIRLSNLAQQEIGRGNRDNALLLASHGAKLSETPPPLIQNALSDAFHLGFDLIPLLVAKPTHRAEVKQSLFSPDDSLIVSVGKDKTARLWNLKGEELAIFQHQDQVIHDAIFSPDSKMIFTCGQDGTIKSWNTAGQEMQSINFGSEVIELGATDQYLLAVGIDQSIKVFDYNGNMVLDIPPTEDLKWWAVQFSPQGDQFLLADRNGDLKLMDFEGNILRTGRFSDDVDEQRYAFTFLENGAIRIASPEAPGWIWRTDGRIRSLSASSSLPEPAIPPTYNILQEIKRLKHPEWGIPLPEAIQYKQTNASATFSHTGQYILSLDRDSTFFLWTLNSQPILQVQLARLAVTQNPPKFSMSIPDSMRHTLPIDWAKWAPSGQRLFTTSIYKSKLWDSDGKKVAEWDPVSGLKTVSFSDDGSLLWMISGLRNGTAGLSVRDSSGNDKLSITFPDDEINQVLPVPNSTQLVILLNSGRIVEYSLSQRQITQQKELEGSPTVGVFTQSGDTLFLGFGNGWVKQWDRVADAIHDLTKHNNNIFDLDIQEENQLILSASGDESARLSAFTGEPVKRIQTNGFAYQSRFSPSGSHFFVRGADNRLQLFSTDGRDSLVLGFVNPIEEAIFSASGQQLLLRERTGESNQLRLTDLSGQTLAVYPHSSKILSMAISPDGLRVYSFEDATARIWLSPLGVLDWLEKHPLAPLSAEEKKIYMVD